MYCSKCGKAKTNNAKFCKYCGQPFSGIDDRHVRGSKSREKLALIIVLSIIIIVGGIGLFRFLNSPEDIERETGSIDVHPGGGAKYAVVQGGVYIADKDGETNVFHSNGSRFTVDGTFYTSQTSLDGTKAAFISDNTLYYTDGEEPQMIATDIYSFALALSGNAVIYTTQMDGDQGSLFIYSDGASTSINSNVFPNYCSISPDGETVIYATANDNGREPENYIWSDGKSSQFSTGLLPVAITDGAQIIYYYKDSIFYVREGYDSGTETELGDSVSSIAFSKDCVQAVYHNNGDAYISIGGGEGEKLSGSINSFIMPGDTQTTVRYDSLQQPVFFYGVTGFENTFYLAGEQVYRIDESFEACMIVESADEVELASDGKTIVFLDNGVIYRINGLLNDAKAEVWVDEDAEAVEIVVVFDESVCFYININSELCYKQEDNSKHVINDIDFYSSNAVLICEKKIFFVCEEILYVTNNAEKPVLVVDVDGKVKDVGRSGAIIIVETDKGYYISRDGVMFVLI